MPNKFTPKASATLRSSQRHASRLGHTYIGSEHLLLALAEDSESIAASILEKYGITYNKILSLLEDYSGVGSESHVTPSDMTPKLKLIIEAAALEAGKSGGGQIGTEHLLGALIGERDSVAVRILESSGAVISEIKNDISAIYALSQKSSEKSKNDQSTQKAHPSGTFCRDMTLAARSGKYDPVLCRESETERMIQILSRRTKNNPCLIGESGVGKTAVVEGLAQRIAAGDVPASLLGKKILSLDLASMVAGSKYRGEFEERLKSLIEEISKDQDAIIFIDEIHTIIGAGAAEGAVDAANIIKPALARGEIKVIGATTVDEYRKHIEKDAALERRFQSVNIPEPSEDESITILKGLREKLEAHHKLKISNESLIAAVRLSGRYIPDRFLPDKAIDLIDEAASRLRMSSGQKPRKINELSRELEDCHSKKKAAIISQDFELAAELRDEEEILSRNLDYLSAKWELEKEGESLTLSEADIAAIVTLQTGIPAGELLEEETEKLSRLEEKLKSQIIGQDEAVEKVVRAIKRGRVGIKNPERPVGSFLFVGQTGVGKTELAKAVAETLFGKRDALIRFDMSEYTEKHSVSKLLGSPPGYVGYEEAGQLSEAVRRHPYSVVLFDEIEKAHPDMFDLLLSVLDDGRLTDSHGRLVSFKNVIIVMTSNLGATKSKTTKSLGFSSQPQSESDRLASRERIERALSEAFRPEFINRIDEIIHFDPLSRESIIKISSLMLCSLGERLSELGFDASFDPSVSELISSVGFDEKYGARPLRRQISRLIEDKLSEAVIAGKIRRGDSFKLTAKDGEIVIEK